MIFLNKYARPLFGILRTSDSPKHIERFLSLTELRTPHGALNIVAAPLAANEFEEVGRGGGIQKALRAQTANDWWLRVRRWRICFFQISHFIVVYNKKKNKKKTGPGSPRDAQGQRSGEWLGKFG